MRFLATAALSMALLLTGCTSEEVPSPPESGAPTSVPSSALLPPSPDPSTAGSLSAVALPDEFLAFTPDIREPEEGEFVPNGTWVFAAKDPQSAAEQTWTRCGTEVPTAPSNVLMGLYANAEGAPGIGQAFEFADAAGARKWFDAYALDLAQCQLLGEEALSQVLETRSTTDVIVNRRMLAGEVWGERVWVRNNTLLFMIIRADAALTELLDAA